MTSENVQEAAAAAAEKLAEAAAAAAAGASPEGDAAEEMLAGEGEGDEWTFLTKAAVAVLVIIVCLVANRVSAMPGPVLMVALVVSLSTLSRRG